MFAKFFTHLHLRLTLALGFATAMHFLRDFVHDVFWTFLVDGLVHYALEFTAH